MKQCGAALAAGALGPVAGLAAEASPGRVRVALLFLSNSAEREIWPYPGFDTASRHQQVIGLLKEGCPQIEFIPVVVPEPRALEKALAMRKEVDGYLVHTVTLNWGLTDTLAQVARLGKPMLVADEFLGGSGVFLVGGSGLRRQGLPVAMVATTRDQDLVAVARLFAEVKQPGTTPASFARRCDEAYRRTYPALGSRQCREDKVALTGISDCVRRLKESRFLIVGAGQVPGREQDFLGAKGIHVRFDELKALYDKVDRAEAAEWAQRWSKQAERVIEATPEWIQNAAAVYLATRQLLKRYGSDSVTMNCLGGFNAGQLPAYPCLGFMQILDDGGQGVCEAMPDDTVSMLMARILTGRAGYVSDPALDTSKNQVVYSHCMAMTRVFGPQGPESRFRIRTLHNRDPRGCCAQSFLPTGYMTTSFRTNFERKQMVIHQAKAVGNLDSDRGCRTQLVGEVQGDIGKLFNEWDRFSWHRVTVYGDIREPLLEFGRALGLETIQEA
jgi:hypothetical protein